MSQLHVGGARVPIGEAVAAVAAAVVHVVVTPSLRRDRGPRESLASRFVVAGPGPTLSHLAKNLFLAWLKCVMVKKLVSA
jgi:hypothetical protein